MSAFTASIARGTLQPAKPCVDGVRCELCGCYWIPDATSFGCPGCELREAVERAGWLDDPKDGP